MHLSSHPHPISPPGPCQPARIVLPLALAATPPPRAPPEAGPPLAYLSRLNVPAPCRPVLSRVLAHPGHHPLHHLPPGKPPPHTPSLFSCYSPGPPEHPPAPAPRARLFIRRRPISRCRPIWASPPRNPAPARAPAHCVVSDLLLPSLRSPPELTRASAGAWPVLSRHPAHPFTPPTRFFLSCPTAPAGPPPAGERTPGPARSRRHTWARLNTTPCIFAG